MQYESSMIILLYLLSINYKTLDLIKSNFIKFIKLISIKFSQVEN